MSINIYWRSVAPKGRTSLNTFAPSAVKDALERAFHGFPCVLNTADIPALRGMWATTEPGDGRPNPYSDLIKAIETHGTIEVGSES